MKTNSLAKQAKTARHNFSNLDGTFFIPRLIICFFLVLSSDNKFVFLGNIYLIAVVPFFGMCTLLMKYRLKKRTKVIISSKNYYCSSLANIVGNGADVFSQTVTALISVYYGWDIMLLNVFALLATTICFYRVPFYILLFMDKPLLAFKWVGCYKNLINNFKIYKNNGKYT